MSESLHEALEQSLSDAVSDVLLRPGAPSTDPIGEVGANLLASQLADLDAEALRHRVLLLGKSLRKATNALESKLIEQPPTSRAGFLCALDEIIGLPPPNSSWDDAERGGQSIDLMLVLWNKFSDRFEKLR